MSPSSSYSPEAIFLKMRRMIFPERVLGRPATIWMRSGMAIGPIACRTCSFKAPAISSWSWLSKSGFRLT